MEKVKFDFTAYNNPKSPISEAYRTIRTNISFSTVDKPVRKILITSSLPNEGKTTVAINLAIILAQAGYRVILVGCDLRNPTIAHHLGGVKTGLTNVLSSDGDYKDYIRHIEGLSLDCLTSGPIPPNPSELLISQKFADLLTQLAQDYDYVLMDTPPLIPVTDAAAISRLADGVILVVESEGVSPQVAKLSKFRLEQAGANIIGCVLNQVKVEHRKGYGYGKNYGYGYGYYYYYGAHNKQKNRKH